LDVRGQKHKVCQKFWSKVYGISTKTIYKKLIKYSNSPLKINQPSQQGQWNRDKIWKNKVDEKKFIQWINAQTKTFSHFTRRLDKKMKWYFSDVDCFSELYRKYIKDLVIKG
jgi:hypothetical protein